jgi:hypothetical protein
MNYKEFKDDIYEDWEDKVYERDVSDKVTRILTHTHTKLEIEKTNGEYVFSEDGNEVIFTKYSYLAPIENIAITKNNKNIEVDTLYILKALYRALKKDGKI